MAERAVHARLRMMRVTQVLRKLSPSAQSVAWAGSCGEDGWGHADAPPCMSSHTWGEIHANWGACPVARSALSWVSGTTFRARAGFV